MGFTKKPGGYFGETDTKMITHNAGKPASRASLCQAGIHNQHPAQHATKQMGSNPMYMLVFQTACTLSHTAV